MTARPSEVATGAEPDDPLDSAPGDGIAMAPAPGGPLLVTAAAALGELSERSDPPADTAGVAVDAPASVNVAVGAVSSGSPTEVVAQPFRASASKPTSRSCCLCVVETHPL